jgi:hypothetical protein
VSAKCIDLLAASDPGTVNTFTGTFAVTLLCRLKLLFSFQSRSAQTQRSEPAGLAQPVRSPCLTGQASSSMKRTRTAVLVSYGVSSDSENEHEPNQRPNPSESFSPAMASASATPAPPSKKRKKLPALPTYLAPAVPLDDPSKHQGRTRSTPHVDGQWAAYVYVPLALRGALRRVVARALDIARGEVTAGSVRVLGGADASTEDLRELHVSLTRPFFLRASQREEMKRAVRDAAKAHPP